MTTFSIRIRFLFYFILFYYNKKQKNMTENQREVVSSTSSRNYLEEMNTTVMKSSLHLFDKSNRAKQSFNKFKEH